MLSSLSLPLLLTFTVTCIQGMFPDNEIIKGNQPLKQAGMAPVRFEVTDKGQSKSLSFKMLMRYCNCYTLVYSIERASHSHTPRDIGILKSTCTC